MSQIESHSGRVSWRDRLPWLIILRVFRPAVSVRLLLCAAVGLVGTIAGWRLIWRLFAKSTDPLIQQLGHNGVDAWPRWPWPTDADKASLPDLLHGWSDLSIVRDAISTLGDTVAQITLPFQLMFSEKIGPAGFGFCLLCAIWSVAVWAFFGGMISRTVAVRLTRDESISWKQAAQFAHSRWLSYFSAPFFPIVGIFLTALPMAVLGLLGRWDFGLLLVGLVWPLALLGGLLMAIFLLGLIFGWPLMFSTISVEGTDSFDALSRSYAYVFQRPLKYLFYAIVAAVLGGLGLLLVIFFGEAVIRLTQWGFTWGAGHPRAHAVFGTGTTDTNGAALILFWNGLVRLIVAAFPLSYFFGAATAIYLLLRRDIDAAEMDEVHLDQEETFGLPSLVHDERGVPAAADLGGTVPPVPGGGTSLREEE